MREGLRTFLELQDGIEVVGEAATASEAIEQASELDARRDPDGPGDAEARRRRRCASCAQRSPRSRVIVLTSFLDDERLMPAIQAGAAGYLLKNVEPAELARAVRTAHAGEAMIDPTWPRGCCAP